MSAMTATIKRTLAGDTRGRVMPASRRGRIVLGATSSEAGGPALCFSVVLRVLATSALAGAFDAIDPRPPWLLTCIVHLVSLYLVARHVRDPRTAEV